MKYIVKPSSKFQRDLKRVQKREYDISLITDIIKKLADGEVLPEINKDHPLNGNYKGCRECHITPDWLLMYEIYNNELILYLTRTGTHSDLFVACRAKRKKMPRKTQKIPPKLPKSN